MARVKQSAEIAVALPMVFRYVADYRHALDWMAGFSEFQPIGERTCGLGARVRASGRLVGVRVTITLEIIDFVPDDHFTSISEGPVRSRTTWAFTPTPRGTLVTFSGEYRVHGLPLPFVGDEIVRHEVAAHTTLSLRHLKRILEGRALAAGASATPEGDVPDAG